MTAKKKELEKQKKLLAQTFCGLLQPNTYQPTSGFVSKLVESLARQTLHTLSDLVLYTQCCHAVQKYVGGEDRKKKITGAWKFAYPCKREDLSLQLEALPDMVKILVDRWSAGNMGKVKSILHDITIVTKNIEYHAKAALWNKL